jgi:hypothetical protein
MHTPSRLAEQSYVIDDERQGMIKSSALWREEPLKNSSRDGLDDVSLN